MNEAQSGPRVLNPFQFISGGPTQAEGAMTQSFAEFVSERDRVPCNGEHGEPACDDPQCWLNTPAEEAPEGSIHPSLLGDVPDLDVDD